MRYLTAEIERLLKTRLKMIFIAGPRQVGKTTLMKHLLFDQPADAYYNWDIDLHRQRILREKEDFLMPTLVSPRKPLRVGLDEIHKYPRWKRFLKGVYDAHKDRAQILVTGSGRLDVYQKGGDSLFGRYYLFRLHPFTLGEYLNEDRRPPVEPDDFIRLLKDLPKATGAEEALRTLEKFSGFPEPLMAAKDDVLFRWRRAHRELVLREDLRDLSQIREIGMIDAMVQLLPSKIGAPLSLNAIREDLNVSYGAVKNWIETLARLYYLFEIRPYDKKLSRALRREAKVYLYDGTVIEDEGARFENLVALHMRKLVDAWNDFGAGDFELNYVRNKEKKETDFIITRGQKPFLLVEAKLSESGTDPSLRYFSERLKPAGAIQVVRKIGPADERRGDISVISAARFLSLI